MEVNYVYTRERKEFGAHLELRYAGPRLLVNIREDPALDEMWITRSMCPKEVQTAPPMSEHEINTHSVPIRNTGMNHQEGGWPKEVDPTESEHTTRFRKKVERDPSFQAAIRAAAERVETVCMLNNALDLTEQYFEAEDAGLAVASATPPSLKITTVFRDPNELKRSVRAVCWGPATGARAPRKLVASYATMEFQHELQVAEAAEPGARVELCTSSYLWDLDNPSVPAFELASPASPITVLRFSTKDSHVLAGGQYNGAVSFWDTRAGSQPCKSSPIEHSHHDPVYDLQWVKSKTGTECATVSTDGAVLWWDIRNLDKPTMQTGLQIRQELSHGGRVRGGRVSRPTTPAPGSALASQRASRVPSPGGTTPRDELMSIGGTALNYDPAAGLTKFLVGAESGHVLSCNSKGKSPEEMVQIVYLAHHGAVRALERSPFYVRYFLTVGDWTVKLWNDDAQSPLLSSSFSPSLLTGGAWSPTRPGVFATSRYDGYVDVWDLFHDAKGPTLSVKVSDSPLTHCSFEGTGRMLAVGTSDGSVLICEVSDSLHLQQPGEKQGVQMLLERELKREKNLEHRSKEQRMRQQRGAAKRTAKSLVEMSDPALIAEMEKEFFATVGGHDWAQ